MVKQQVGYVRSKQWCGINDGKDATVKGWYSACRYMHLLYGTAIPCGSYMYLSFWFQSIFWLMVFWFFKQKKKKIFIFNVHLKTELRETFTLFPKPLNKTKERTQWWLSWWKCYCVSRALDGATRLGQSIQSPLWVWVLFNCRNHILMKICFSTVCQKTRKESHGFIVKSVKLWE